MIEESSNMVESVGKLRSQVMNFLEDYPIGGLKKSDFNSEVGMALVDVLQLLKRFNIVTESHLTELSKGCAMYSSAADRPCCDTVKPDNPGAKLERRGGFDKIRDFSRGAEEIIIVDPYFFGGDAAGTASYVSEIAKASRLKSSHMRRLRVIYDETKGRTKKIIRDFKKECSDHSIDLIVKSNGTFHDRFWIKDRKSALLIGTSLGGLGNRFCFITRMGKRDLSDTLDFLRSEKLL